MTDVARQRAQTDALTLLSVHRKKQLARKLLKLFPDKENEQ